MATLFKEVNYNLARLIQSYEMGFIGLPDIQHPFIWPDSKGRDLFISMYKEYPVGYFLFWANGINSLKQQFKQSVLLQQQIREKLSKIGKDL